MSEDKSQIEIITEALKQDVENSLINTAASIIQSTVHHMDFAGHIESMDVTSEYLFMIGNNGFICMTQMDQENEDE